MVSGTARSPVELAKDELVLRIHGTSRHGQIIRLRSEKCTLGASANCTLRLRARGVRPVHCLIVRGRAASVVRCWHPDTRLNGRAFSEAILAPGDRLGVGPIEFEVLGGLRLEDPPGQAAPIGSEAPQEPREQDDATTSKSSASLQEDLQRQADALDSLAASLNEREAQLAEQASRLLAQEAETRARLEAQQGEWEVRQRALDDREAELRSRQQAFEEDRRRWEAHRQESERQLDLRREQIQTREAELEARQRAFETERQAWEANRGALEAAHEAETSPEKSETLEERPEPPTASRPVSAEAPVRTEDVLRRLGVLPQFEPEDAGDQGLQHPDQSPSAPRADANRPSAQPPAQSEHEESIEDYMARLLHRVRSMAGGAAESSGPKPSERYNNRGVSRDDDGADTGDSTPRDGPEPVCQREPVELSPRAVAPEKFADLTAMREVANVSALSAIDRHARRVRRRVLARRVALVLLSFAAAAGLGWTWWQQAGPGAARFAAAMVCVVVAIYWGLQGVTARLHNVPSCPTPVQPPSSDNPPSP